jgi:hypothetical protein
LTSCVAPNDEKPGLFKVEQPSAGRSVHYASDMDTNTLIIILLLVFLFGGGGFYYRGRRRG